MKLMLTLPLDSTTEEASNVTDVGGSYVTRGLGVALKADSAPSLEQPLPVSEKACATPLARPVATNGGPLPVTLLSEPPTLQ